MLVGGVIAETMKSKPHPKAAAILRALATVVGASARLGHNHVAAHTGHPSAMIETSAAVPDKSTGDDDGVAHLPPATPPCDIGRLTPASGSAWDAGSNTVGATPLCLSIH